MHLRRTILHIDSEPTACAESLMQHKENKSGNERFPPFMNLISHLLKIRVPSTLRQQCHWPKSQFCIFQKCLPALISVPQLVVVGACFNHKKP